MFFRFRCFDDTTLLINIERINHIYSDSEDSTLFHIVIIDDLEEEFEFLIEFSEYCRFETFLNLCMAN